MKLTVHVFIVYRSQITVQLHELHDCWNRLERKHE
jgi:hypothetical protein